MIVWCQRWEGANPPPKPSTQTHTQLFEHHWTCEAAAFSEAYNSTLCALASKKSAVWPLCSTRPTGLSARGSQTDRGWKKTAQKNRGVWFMVSFSCVHTRASVAETSCELQHSSPPSPSSCGSPDPQHTYTHSYHAVQTLGASTFQSESATNDVNGLCAHRKMIPNGGLGY